MRRSLTIACLIVWMSAAGVFAQRAVERSEERAAGAAAAEVRAARRAAARERAKGTDTPLERWNRMTHEERQRALAELPTERRRELQQKLQQFRILPPGERQQLRERYQVFTQLPPQQQAHARDCSGSSIRCRRIAVRWYAVNMSSRARSMSEPERNARMNSEAFRTHSTLLNSRCYKT
jgi:hypothetical protein